MVQKLSTRYSIKLPVKVNANCANVNTKPMVMLHSLKLVDVYFELGDVEMDSLSSCM